VRGCGSSVNRSWEPRITLKWLLNAPVLHSIVSRYVWRFVMVSTLFVINNHQTPCTEMESRHFLHDGRALPSINKDLLEQTSKASSSSGSSAERAQTLWAESRNEPPLMAMHFTSFAGGLEELGTSSRTSSRGAFCLMSRASGC